MTGTAPYRHGVADLVASGRPVRALVDTAGTALCLRQSLVDELGLDIHEWLHDGDVPVSVVEPPELAVGDFVLDTDGLVAYGFEDVRPLGLAARGADVLVPASVLRRHHVVLDDPGGTIAAGPSGAFERRGLAVPATFDGDTGIVLTSITVDGEAFDVVVDTAITASLAVDALLRAWQGDHPDWPASASGVGPANMTGLPMEARVPVLRVPAVGWGSFEIPAVAFAWRGESDVIAEGALGGNVLRLFRLDVDWPAGSLRVEQGAPFPEHDAELVGVVLVLGDDGYEVAATVSGLDDVRPGDGLERVDGVEVAGLPLVDVLDLLRGTPGDRKRLSLRRGDERLDVDAPVLRLV